MAGARPEAKGKTLQNNLSKIKGLLQPLLYIQQIFPGDERVILRQMRGRNFNSSIAVGIVKRCRLGKPQVLLCAPLFELKPFPTTFWLSCPYLVGKCGKEEAAGGVKQLESYAKNYIDSERWINFNVKHSVIRLFLLSEGERLFLSKVGKNIFDRLRLSGIGGMGCPVEMRMKCLHLQVASWLALGEHPAEGWLKGCFTALECDNPDRYCT